MTYAVGVDLGTTFTAAAICEPKRRPEMVSLGSNSYAVPSVLYLKENGEFLSGEAAEMRAAGDPTRVVRHFKRRLGDDIPIRIAGTPFAAQALSAHLLKWVLRTVSERQGSDPECVVLTHPANWGPYRRELFEQAATSAGAKNLVLLSEPEAAAVHYASSERVEPGDLIGVYDLGGGTFDAVVMQRTGKPGGPARFEIVGQPHGVERLGGLDFDDVVWQFVLEASGLDGSDDDTPNPLDDDDPSTLAAALQLRQRCVDTKQLLSFDTTANIHVVFPGVTRSVRMNRSEFEQRIAPRLKETIHAFNSALSSGDLNASDLSRILLVGGSSRIPVVSQTLTREFGRPIAVDSDPKNTVALGAARRGAMAKNRSPRSGPPPRLRPAAEPLAVPDTEDLDITERAMATEDDITVPTEARLEVDITDPNETRLGIGVAEQMLEHASARAERRPAHRESSTKSEIPGRTSGASAERGLSIPSSKSSAPPAGPSTTDSLPAQAQPAARATPTKRNGHAPPDVEPTSPSVDPRPSGEPPSSSRPQTAPTIDPWTAPTIRSADQAPSAERDRPNGFEADASILDAVSAESVHRVRLVPQEAPTNPFADTEGDEVEEVEATPMSLRPLIALAALTVLVVIVLALTLVI